MDSGFWPPNHLKIAIKIVNCVIIVHSYSDDTIPQPYCACVNTGVLDYHYTTSHSNRVNNINVDRLPNISSTMTCMNIKLYS